jgi:hypothetical protein
LALQQYPAAEDSLKKASSIAPLDVQLLAALAYGEFMNRDYQAVVATVRNVHDRKHEGASLVHYFAAGSWEAQGELPKAQQEMETLLLEDPKSASIAQFRQILDEIKAEHANRMEAKLHPAETFSFATPTAPSFEDASRQAQQVLQDTREKTEIAEAEAEPDAGPPRCRVPARG